MVRTTDFNKLREAAKKVETPANSFRPDERIYKLERNDDGNAFALIRFLPQVEDEDTYYVMNYSHFFTENGKTYSEACPTSVGEPCPVCEYNKEHWKNDYTDLEKKRKRLTRYVTNILVLKDKANPEREGKVFLFEYGVKLHKKISNAIYDNDEEGTKGYNVFDFKTGKNFKLKIKTVSNYANYDDSEFVADPSPIADSDKKIEAIDKMIYPLKEFLPTKEKLKSYNELKSIFLTKILNSTPSDGASTSSAPTQGRHEDKDDGELFQETSAPKSDSKAKSKATTDEDEFFMDKD